MSEEKSPALAAILSLIIPGLGQLYNGQVAKAFICVLISVFIGFSVLLLIGILLLPIWWVLCAYDAYKTATIINDGEEPPLLPF